MVRHFTFITTVLVVMGLLTHIDAKAQGQDQHHLWIGNPLNKIVDKGDTDMGRCISIMSVRVSSLIQVVTGELR